VRDKLTMLVIAGTRTDAHSFNSQVGMRSESGVGVKCEKSGGDVEIMYWGCWKETDEG